MKRETVVVLDFGGQYNQLIARRVRECNVYCEIYSYKTDIEKIKEIQPKGIIFTGGPNSVYLEDSPAYTEEIYKLGIPILGICYGSQLMMHQLGGKVEKAPVREYGKIEVHVNTDSALFQGVSPKTICWMSHNDYISKEAPGFEISARTNDCPVAAVENKEKKLYAVQFHPEVLHTQEGTKMLSNFVYQVCGCAGDWKMDSFVEDSIKAIREKVGNGKVLCALSGGVDSSVAAVLLSKAVGNQLTCVFVDHGLLRKNEGDEVEAVFGPEGSYDLNFIRVNAQERFYEKLKGVEEPERKRKIIGEEFIGDDTVAMVLGDNIFAGHGLKKRLKAAVKNAESGEGATVFGYYVDDPERFGIVEFDHEGKAISIEEKPEHPKSNYCVTGLYFYDNRVVEYAKNLKPSARGELEITDLNRIYLEKGELNVELLGQGFTWLDTGTHESLVEATNFVKTMESHQHRKIGCLEEIAYLNGWITKEDVLKVYEILKKNQYGQYLKDVLDGKYLDVLH